MSTVSYQIVFRTKHDFKSEILKALKQSFDDSYIKDYDTVTLEDAVQIKYEKSLIKSTKVIVGFEITLFEDLPEIEMVITRISDNLLSSDEVEAVFKFEDLDLFSKLDALHNDLFKIEMRLREAMTLIFVDTYGTDYYNLLKETNVKPHFEGRSNLSNKEQKEAFLGKRFENEFFHILFNEYGKLTELKSMRLDDIVFIAETSKNFEEFRNQIVFRGIIKEDYLNFINSIKAEMEILEKVRNCFAHNRSLSEDESANFERVKEQLTKKIDDFLDSLKHEK